MFSGKNSGSGGCTNGVCDAGLGKEHSLFCNSVDIWGLNQFFIIGRDGLVGMIV